MGVHGTRNGKKIAFFGYLLLGDKSKREIILNGGRLEDFGKKYAYVHCNVF